MVDPLYAAAQSFIEKKKRSGYSIEEIVDSEGRHIVNLNAKFGLIEFKNQMRFMGLKVIGVRSIHSDKGFTEVNAMRFASEYGASESVVIISIEKSAERTEKFSATFWGGYSPQPHSELLVPSAAIFEGVLGSPTATGKNDVSFSYSRKLTSDFYFVNAAIASPSDSDRMLLLGELFPVDGLYNEGPLNDEKRKHAQGDKVYEIAWEEAHVTADKIPFGTPINGFRIVKRGREEVYSYPTRISNEKVAEIEERLTSDDWVSAADIIPVKAEYRALR